MTEKCIQVSDLYIMKPEKKIEEWLRKSGYCSDTPIEIRERLVAHYQRMEERKKFRKKSQSDRYYGEGVIK